MQVAGEKNYLEEDEMNLWPFTSNQQISSKQVLKYSIIETKFATNRTNNVEMWEAL